MAFISLGNISTYLQIKRFLKQNTMYKGNEREIKQCYERVNKQHKTSTVQVQVCIDYKGYVIFTCLY